MSPTCVLDPFSAANHAGLRWRTRRAYAATIADGFDARRFLAAVDSTFTGSENLHHGPLPLRAVAIMFNHFHIVVGVPGDPSPGKLLGDFKSWGTRRLSEHFGAPASETWWTERGSKRKLPDDRAVNAAVHYVLYEHPNPLVTCSPG